MRDDFNGSTLKQLNRDIVPVCYLVDLEKATPRYMSTNMLVEANNQVWTPFKVSVDSISNWETVSLRLDNFKNEYTQSVLSALWKGTSCSVYLAVIKPAYHETGRYVNAGYVKKGYVSLEYTEPSEIIDIIPLFAGEITSINNVGQTIEMVATRQAISSQYSPRVRIDKPVFNHIPVEGSVINWNGDTLVLER